MKELFLLDPDVTFLNHGSFGACPRPVFEVYQRWQRELEREPVEFIIRRLPDLLAEARAALGAYLGARAEDLTFVQNAGTGVNMAGRAIELRPGDEVLATDLEYGALNFAWEWLCARAGATYVRAPWDELFEHVTERTRVLFVSHITSETALLLPVEELVARGRELGLITVVDGAHAPGQLPLALDELGPDVYAGNCHKWLCAPKGAAFLYARPEAQELIDPLVVSWDWSDGAPFADLHRWQGTRDPSAYLAVPAAIDFQAEHDWPRVRERCRALLAAADFGLEPLTDDFVQMRGYRVEHPDPPALKRRLYDEHRIEVPVFESRAGWSLRVSVQGYNDAADLDALATALAALSES
jgi:isopenicillin-N epimerase